MGDENDGLVSHATTQALAEHVVRGVVVHSGEGIVQQDEVGWGVGRTGHVDALSLSTGQVDTAKTAEGHVALHVTT
jgi:hypothetical protein